VPRRALERLPRAEKSTSASGPFNRPLESVSVGADARPTIESKSNPQPSINSDDLDVPTFLRNRR